MKRYPRIIMVSGNTPPAVDGVCHYTGQLLRQMHTLRPDWELLWLGRRQRWFHEPFVTKWNLSVVRPNHTWRPFSTNLTCMLIRLLRPDVLHIQDQVHSFHQTGAAARLARAAAGRVITTLHEFHSELPSVSQTVELVGRSKILIANDARTSERCALRTGRVPDFTWWSGTNVTPPDLSWRVREVPFLVTTFGQLSAIKAVDLVHDALVRVRERRPGVRWQIVGPLDPVSDPFHADLQRRFSQEWVRFTGGFEDLEDRGLRTALGSSQLMVLPFADGASPRRTTLQTAWAFGLPVVTTPPEAKEPNVIDGVNCILVREPTATAWSEAIERVLADSALRARLRAGSLRTAERFRWSRLARLHVELYDSFVRGEFPGGMQGVEPHESSLEEGGRPHAELADSGG